MAGLFESFRNSSMPKRLVRYAISQADVFDTDSMDLDNLDVAWGMNTVLEFRDVGLQLKKLQKLLNLPTNFGIRKAKVANLRITLPVDIYSSPIQLEVAGADVYLKVSSKAEESKEKDKTAADAQSPAVPSAVDLAQSFLQLQPSSETEALRDALVAESHEKRLDESAAMGLSGELDSDDDTASSASQTLGTGQALNLPSFFAGFLQGIIDRVQTSIEGVTFQLEVDVAVDRESSEPSTEPVTFQLVLSQINIEGVTTATIGPGNGFGDVAGGTTTDDVPRLSPKNGKRHVSLVDVSAFLISEANVFSTLARSPSMPSSLSSRSPAMPSKGAQSRSSTASSAEGFRPLREPVISQNDVSDPPRRTQHHNVTEEMTDSMASVSSAGPERRYALQDSEDAFNIPYDLGGGSGEPAPGPSDEEFGPGAAPEAASSFSTPRASLYGEPLLDSPMHTLQPTIAAGISWHTSNAEPQLQLPTHSTISAPPASQEEAGHVQHEPNDLVSQTLALEDSFHSSMDQPVQTARRTNDLTESHVFSHEEAESMYMSAFSQAEPRPARNAIPGAWEADEYDDDAHQSSQAVDAIHGLNISSEQKPATPPIHNPFEGRGCDLDSVPTPPVAPVSAGAESEHGENEELEEQLDAAATPKGPAGTRLAKKILSLKYISIYIPSNHQITQPFSPEHLSEDMAKSVSPHLPGAFSVYSTAGPSSTYRDGSESDQKHDADAANQVPESDKSIEVNLAPLEIFFDASIGFLLAMVVSELLQPFKSGAQNQRDDSEVAAQGAKNSNNVAMPSATTDIKVHAEKISILLLDKLAGMADTAERFFSVSSSSHLDLTRDILLQMTLESLAIGVSLSPGPPTVDTPRPSTEVSVGLQRFRFGYVDSDILSFDQHTPLRASVRDAFPPAGDDMSVKIVQSSGSTKCEINTLPLLISMDLQRLDETFSWFGGLSSFLNMGSSSIGCMTPAKLSVAALPQKNIRGASTQKQRGVRFDAPIVPDDESVAAENKVDMRIGGVHVELIGKDCSVALDSSAVKAVSREEGIGVGVSRVRLTGPYLRNSQGEPPVTVDIINTRLEYLNTPKDKDLERLLELITPSKVRFDERDDVIMVDTLLRQRRNGPLLRVSVDDLNAQMHNLAQLSCLPALGEEIARLGTVAKYLPEDDRPGLLTLGRFYRLNISANIGGKMGALRTKLTDLELAHITIPSLVSIATGSLSLLRNETEELIGSSAMLATTTPSAPTKPLGNTALTQPLPALMMRIIGNDIEPVIKIKLWGLNIEYRVPTLMDLLGLAEDATPQDFEASLAASVANLGEKAHSAIASGHAQPKTPSDVSSDEPSMDARNMAVPKGLAGVPETAAKPTAVDLSLHDCVIGLNPLGLVSKMNVVLADARVQATLPQDEDIDAVAHLNKVALLLIDDVSAISAERDATFAHSHTSHPPSGRGTDMTARLCSRGFVDVCQISSARVSVHISEAKEDDQRAMELEVRDDLLVLETCADSTQTLINLANALKPPTPPNKEAKFKTEVVPVNDLLASISIDAFGRAEGNYNFDEDFILEEEEDPEALSDEDIYGARFTNPSALSGYLQSRVDLEQSVASLPSVVDDDMILGDDDLDIEGMQGAVAERIFSASSSISETGPASRAQSVDQYDGLNRQHANRAEPSENLATIDELEVDDGFFGTASETAAEGLSLANRWNSTRNGYDKSLGGAQMDKSPLQIRVRDVHFIWNLFDGYDWQHTRDTIAKTVEEVEAKAYDLRTRHRRRSGHDHYNAYAEEEEEETVIGDFLFNSIYIGIPSNHDPRDLTQVINQNLYGDNTETESVAATTISAMTARAGGTGHTLRPSHGRAKKLKLNRSRRHKITFELGGVAADVVVFPPGSGETQASIDFRVRDLDIFDHVPTSTWKKFATYDRDAGERPIDGDMLRLELMLVKPVPELAATEYVLKVSVLPLRLHVDQDALDFITRFFEFKDESAVPTHTSPSDIPFIQRAEIRDIPVQLDFKPKRVDYAGLRSGHTTEFMNFLILDGSRMTLRHTIIYGISGFDRLGNTLNDIWMPDIKQHQLPGVLAGLAPVRSLVTVGSGFKDLIEIPIQEYRHNGRIVRSISKGAVAFAKSTGTELVKLGAKVATGTQYVLQGAEGILVQKEGELGGMSGGGGLGISSDVGGHSADGGGNDSDDERKQISLYADQPTGVVQGLHHAYSSLARDLHIARDAIIAVPAEVRETTSATGAAKVVAKHAPTIIFRPAIGATKAIGQTLMGATNSLDPQNLRRAEDKYKSGPGRI